MTLCQVHVYLLRKLAASAWTRGGVSCHVRSLMTLRPLYRRDHLESPTRAQLSVASQLFPLSRQAWMKASGPSGPERSPALRSRRISQLSLAGFLRLCALDLWSRIILGRGGHPVHCRILSSLPGLCSLESQYCHLPPAPHPDVTP